MNAHVMKQCTGFAERWWNCLVTITREGQMSRTQLGSWRLALLMGFLDAWEHGLHALGMEQLSV
jgi:hypothetical protein